MIVIEKEKNSAGKEWLKRINPLEGLSITQAKNVYNYSRAHGSPLLQKIYDEIELTDPVLMTCVERRQSALAGLGWRAVADAAAADPTKAEAQRQAIEQFAAQIVNLEEAIEHLDLAFFRGFSVVQPIWENGAVNRISILDSWNFLKGDDGALLWNPNCTLYAKDCTPITPEARCVILQRRRAIDWPALSIFIRKYLGERDWGRFIERYGIPPVDVVMAPNATDLNRGEYEECGEAAKDGRTVAWPSGTNVSRAEGARGTDPFTAFIEHQEKLIVLMATGGTLTSLAQADTGSLAGGAQMDVWTQIVKRDGVLIGAALDRDLFAPFLRQEFPGKPIMAHFALGQEEEPSANETADLAGKLKTAGYLIDQSELEEQIGMKLVKDESSEGLGGLGSLVRNKSGVRGAPALPNDTPNGRAGASRTPPNDSALLAAFAKDTSAAGKAVAELLQDPTPEAAKALLDRLPSLLPDDPEMATVIAEAMAEEFGDQIVKNRQGEKCPDCGQWLDANGVCHECHGADELAKMGYNPDSAETQAAEIGKGKAAIEKCLEEKCDVLNAISRGDIGLISFVYSTGGDNPRGIVRFLERPDARAHLAETIVRGEAAGPYQDGQKLNLKYGGYVATLRLTSDGKAGYPKNWVLTGYGPEDKTKGSN